MTREEFIEQKCQYCGSQRCYGEEYCDEYQRKVNRIPLTFTPEEVKQSLKDVGIELVDGELNMEKPEFFSKLLTAKDVKNFLKDVPDNATVVFSEGCITFLFDGNARALNKWGATWENGVGYPSGGTTCCGECTHFRCDICKGYALEE